MSLTAGGKVFLKKLQVPHLVNNFPEFSETQTCIIVFISNRHLLLSWARLITVNATYIPTYLLTPWSRVLLENLTGLQLVKKFPAFYETRRFIAVFISARHLSLSWASSIQSHTPTTDFLKIHLNIILPSAYGSPQWSLSLTFPHQNPVHASPLPHTRHMPRPSHSSRFYNAKNIMWSVQII